jgi:hypothetical protein
MEADRSILEWWLTTFSQEEKGWMVDVYQPLSIGVSVGPVKADLITEDRPLIRLLSRVTDDDAFRQLSNLSTWFSKPGSEHCSIAFAKKAMAFYAVEMPILDRHFALANQCISLYRWRETEPGALEGAIAACEACIGIHREAAVAAKAEFGIVPAHHCFRQLRIIEEKRGNFGRAIELCEQAKAGGWADDWDKDIARLRKKLAKKAQQASVEEAACSSFPELPPSEECIGPPSSLLDSQPLPQSLLTRIIRTATGGRWPRST